MSRNVTAPSARNEFQYILRGASVMQSSLQGQRIVSIGRSYADLLSHLKGRHVGDTQFVRHSPGGQTLAFCWVFDTFSICKRRAGLKSDGSALLGWKWGSVCLTRSHSPHANSWPWLHYPHQSTSCCHSWDQELFDILRGKGPDLHSPFPHCQTDIVGNPLLFWGLVVE